MKKKLSLLFAAILLAGVGIAGAAEKVATVTETVNQVDHGASASDVTSPAHVGTFLQDGDYLKTGTKSLAELQLDNKTITRMGANTIFNYSVAQNEVDLQSGTILFSKPKDGQQLNIKTAAVTAAVVGTTGFMQSGPHGFLFGLIEGHSKIFSHGKVYVIGPGEILVLIPGHEPFIFSFDVPHMIATSPLFLNFHLPLPNQRYIDEEIAAYLEALHRGFIVPHQGPFETYVSGYYGSHPGFPGYDNALNALFLQLNPPPGSGSGAESGGGSGPNNCHPPRCRPPPCERERCRVNTPT